MRLDGLGKWCSDRSKPKADKTGGHVRRGSESAVQVGSGLHSLGSLFSVVLLRDAKKVWTAYGTGKEGRTEEWKAGAPSAYPQIREQAIVDAAAPFTRRAASGRSAGAASCIVIEPECAGVGGRWLRKDAVNGWSASRSVVGRPQARQRQVQRPRQFVP
jgi:hypothetical protein